MVSMICSIYHRSFSHNAAFSSGYDGWLYTDAPPTNLLTDPAVFDQQLIDLFTGVQNAVDPVPGVDWNTPANDVAEGGGIVGLTKQPNHQRSTVR